MGYLTDHAREEFKHTGWVDSNGTYCDEMQAVICGGVLDLLKVLEGQGHSGFSINQALSMFENLARHKPLSALNSIEDNPDEWCDVSESKGGQPLYQNKRANHVFKDPNGYCDIAANVCWTWVYGEETGKPEKRYFHGPASARYVDMPYTPGEPVPLFVPTGEFPNADLGVVES